MSKKTYFITTFGCQMNKSDSERLAAVLESAGYKKTSNIKKADLVAYNTCSVRQTAEDRVFGANKIVAGLKKKNPSMQVMLTGCMLHYGEKQLKKRLPLFDFFIDIKEIGAIPSILGTNKKLLAKEYLAIRPSVESAFSAFVPISYGCNNYCSYCIVPFARGSEHSRSAKEIIAEAEKLVKKGYKEIWLLGQNVNSYGIKDKTYWAGRGIKNKTPRIERGCCSFADLIRGADKIPGNWWLRFASPHPKDFSDDLIDALARAKHFARYINLPIQSGDNNILRKMNRFYTAKDYIELIKKLRRAMPDIAISTDIIVGFPGETKKRFRHTASLMKKVGFDMAYIAKYSPRPGTLAAKKYKDNVSLEEKKRRFNELSAILKKTAMENNKKYVKRTQKVLIDEIGKNAMFGKTESYKTVKIPFSNKKAAKAFLGKFTAIKITGAKEFCLEGKILGHK